MALVDPTRDVGVPGGAELLAFAEFIVGPDRNQLDRARSRLEGALGAPAVPAAAAIAATFSMNDRIANACGIPIVPGVLGATADFRERLGLNRFRSAQNTFKHFPNV